MTKKKSQDQELPLWKNEWVLIGILSIFYLVGLIGLQMDAYRQQFIDLSVYHLLLTAVILGLSRKNDNKTFWFFSFVIFFFGMLVEIVGTQSGLLFGTYGYSDVLGLSFMQVPLIIGVNWVVLVIACSTWTMNMKLPVWGKTLIAAGLMVLIDIFMEPIAVEFNYWTWQGGDIPIYNYVCWYVLSLPMHYGMLKWKLLENNWVPKIVGVWMLVFFVVLNISQ